MIDTILKLSKIGTLLSIMFVGIMSGILIIKAFNLPTEISQTLKNLNETISQFNTTIVNTNTTVSKVNDTLDNVNRPCPVPNQQIIKPCGLIPDIARTLATFRLTSGAVLVATDHYNSNLKTLDSQEQQLFKDIHETLQSGNDTFKSLTDIFNNLNDTKSGLPASISKFNLSLDDINKIMNSPETKQLAKNLTNTTSNISGISDDARYRLHQLLHPDKVKLTLWSGTEATLQWIKKNAPIPSLF